MPTEDRINVTIQYIQTGQAAVEKSVMNLNKQLAGLMKTNASLSLTTGKMFPDFQRQAQVLGMIGGESGKAAQGLVQLRQQGSLFSKLFSGDMNKNLGEFLNEYGHGMSKLGAGTSALRARLEQEFKLMRVYTDQTESGFRALTAPERWRIMGAVAAAEIRQVSDRLINWGKNAQWVGRQMMVGLTLPIALFAKETVMSFLTFNKAQTELQKYLIQSGMAVEQFGNTTTGVFGEQILPAVEKITEETGLYRDEVLNLASAWAAAGYDLNNGLLEYTKLSAEIQLLTQGEIDLQGATELVRSVQATWGLSLAQTTDQMHKLVLIAGETSLTMNEVATALPVVSSSASLLGISAAQTAAALAGMREQGVPASQAANTLKFSINRLINPTQKAEDAWNGLNKELTNGKSLYHTLFNSKDEGRGIKGIEDIAHAMASLPSGEQGRLAGVLFGGYRADRMLKLIQAINTETSQFNRGLEAATDSERALSIWTQQLSVVQESSAQKFKVMKAELITLAQKFGELIYPYVEKFGEALLRVMNKFIEAPGYIKNFVIALGAILAAVGPVTYIIAQLTEATGMLGKVFTAFPTKALFGLRSSVEMPFGIESMAAANPSNPLYQLLAGVPLKPGGKMDASVAKELFGTVGAFQKQGLIGEDIAQYLQVQALKNGALPDNMGLLKNFDEKQISRLFQTNNLEEFKTALGEINKELAATGVITESLDFNFSPATKDLEAATAAAEVAKKNLSDVGVAGASMLDAAEKRITKFYGADSTALEASVKSAWKDAGQAGGPLAMLENALTSRERSSRVSSTGLTEAIRNALLGGAASGEDLKKSLGINIGNLEDMFGITSTPVGTEGTAGYFSKLLGKGFGTRTELAKAMADYLGSTTAEVERFLAGETDLLTVLSGGKRLMFASPETAMSINTALDTLAVSHGKNAGAQKIIADVRKQVGQLTDEATKGVVKAEQAVAAAAAVGAEGIESGVKGAAKQIPGQMSLLGAESAGAFVDELDDGLAKNIPASSDRTVTTWMSSLYNKLKGESTWKSRIAELFKSKILPIAAPPTQGTGTAGLFNLAFGSPVKIIAALLLVTGLLSKLPELTAGWADEFKQIGKIIGGIVAKIIDIFNEMFGSGKNGAGDLDQSFVTLGDTIGNFLLTLTRVVEVISNILIPIFKNIVQAGAELVGVFVDIFAAIIALIHLDIKGFFENLLKSLIGFGTQGSVVAKIIGRIAAALVGLMVVQRLSAIFSALQLGIQGVIGANLGLIASYQAVGTTVAEVSTATAAFMNPWILIPAVLITALTLADSFFNKVDKAAEAAAEHAAELSTQISNINDGIKSGIVDMSGYLNELKSMTTDIINALGDKGFLTNVIDDLRDYPDIFHQQMSEIIDIANKDGISLNESFRNYLQMPDVHEDITRFAELIKAPLHETVANLEGLNQKKLTSVSNDINNQIETQKRIVENATAWIKSAEEQGLDSSSFVKQREDAQLLLFVLGQLKREIVNTGVSEQAYWGTALTDITKKARDAGEAIKDMGNKAKEAFAQAFESQLSALTSRVEDAVMSQFDENAQARTDALDEQSQRRIDAFDKEAESQVNAIQKQIDAIDKQNEKEAWLQQQEEWRKRRREILRQQELDEATAYAERLKAINEGRYDDARLLALQSMQSRSDVNQQLKDLNKEEKQGREQHKEDKQKARLEKEKEALQKQLDKQKEILQKQIDAQKKALADQIAAQREYLTNLLSEYDEYSVKNKKQWEQHYDGIKKIANKFGVDVNDIQGHFTRSWGMSIQQGLNDAYRDAYNIAVNGGRQTGQAAQAAVDGATTPANPEDLHVYDVLEAYARAQQAAATKGGLTGAQLAGWIRNIRDALAGASKDAKNFAYGYMPTTSPTTGGSGNSSPAGMSLHTGGQVPERGRGSGTEVPAKLLTGEYVAQRKAVKHYGKGFFDKVNNLKFDRRALQEYHSGGYVSNAIGNTLGTRMWANMIPGQELYKAGYSYLGGITRKLTHTFTMNLGRSLIRNLSRQTEGIGYQDQYGYSGGGPATSPTGDSQRTNTAWGFITTAAKNWIENVIKEKLATGFGTVSIRPIAGTNIYSQHSYGNAVDNFKGAWSDYNDSANPDLFSLWEWAKNNAAKLKARLLIFNRRQFYNGTESSYPGVNPHMGHVHADFYPEWGGDPYQGGYPIGHKGGIFMGDRFKKFKNLKFEAPALLQPGEGVIPKNITQALDKAGSGSAGGNVYVEVKIDTMYGDEQSYRKLYDTLENVGNKIARERGLGHNTVVRVGGFK